MKYRAAVLHQPGQPLVIEEVTAAPLAPDDVLVKIKAAGLCHTDLEIMQGQLSFPMPIILGHEASGVVEAIGSEVSDVAVGDHVVLSWNPSCGHCFYCDRDQPILCDVYTKRGVIAKQFDGKTRAYLNDGRELHHLMFLGSFAEYCIVPQKSAIPVSKKLDFDVACLIGCGVMTGAGAALNIAEIEFGDTVVVIGCGAVGLSAVQGAVLAGASQIVAVDLDGAKLDIAMSTGATHAVNAKQTDAVEAIKALTSGRGADVIIESAGSPQAYRTTTEAVRPGGQVIWLGKVPVSQDVAFRWGSLMGEKRIRRSSYGGARPGRDFPRLAQAHLDGKMNLSPLISRHITLEEINEGFDALKRGETIRSVVMF
jgi:S-(hydroxymethyl)glutathione dehydrogenase/alcohol dehydrogenase